MTDGTERLCLTADCLTDRNESAHTQEGWSEEPWKGEQKWSDFVLFGRAKLTINLLDSQQVVHGQFEVVGVHVLVEGSHDGRGVVGVLQAQRVAKFMHRYQEQVVT